jgi:hypothetical protein
VVLDWFVERRGDDFTFDRPAHVGHFFGALANQADHEMDVRAIRADAVRDRFEQHCLAGFGR